jgi:hypothetical protein
MAVSRYDERKNYEEEEANAIGTEYVRAELLPQGDTAKIQVLLVKYLDLRVESYNVGDLRRRSELNAQTVQIKNEMWRQVSNAAKANPFPLMVTVVTGMNEVFNRQGYTQAAWRNRLPVAAWGLMAVIAVLCSAEIGFATRHPKPMLLLILPLAVSLSFLLIADIDSPRGGLIRVIPQNLISLQQSLGY